MAIIAWESKGKPDAIGDRRLEFTQNGQLYGFSVGLMQIRDLPGRPLEYELLDPETNIAYGAAMYRAGHSLCPWTSARKLGLAGRC